MDRIVLREMLRPGARGGEPTGSIEKRREQVVVGQVILRRGGGGSGREDEGH
jgi:hypothetical protein